eukprot:Skav214406  [mRNA]  locus=scaffold3796:11788:12264:+ [translate_table: standard]
MRQTCGAKPTQADLPEQNSHDGALCIRDGRPHAGSWAQTEAKAKKSDLEAIWPHARTTVQIQANSHLDRSSTGFCSGQSSPGMGLQPSCSIGCTSRSSQNLCACLADGSLCASLCHCCICCYTFAGAGLVLPRIGAQHPSISMGRTINVVNHATHCSN